MYLACTSVVRVSEIVGVGSGWGDSLEILARRDAVCHAFPHEDSHIVYTQRGETGSQSLHRLVPCDRRNDWINDYSSNATRFDHIFQEEPSNRLFESLFDYGRGIFRPKWLGRLQNSVEIVVWNPDWNFGLAVRYPEFQIGRSTLQLGLPLNRYTNRQTSQLPRRMVKAARKI